MNKLFLLLNFLILALTSYSQENVLGKEITLNYDNISIENTLKEIEFKAKVTFSYNSDFFPVDSIISIHSTAPLNIHLTTILGSQIEIKSIGNNIILRNKNNTKVDKKAKKQKYDIRGVVLDSYTGNKLSEVTIYQIDGVRSALSKKDGSYNLKIASTASYVELSFSRKNYYDTIIMIKPSEMSTIKMKLTPNVISPITPRKVKDLPISSERTIDSSAFVKLLVPEKQKRLIDNIPFLGEPQPVQISLLPNIGSNLDMNAAMENKGSINILAGYSRAINGVEVGVGINIVRENVTGTQFAGFGNLVGGDIDGIQAAGFFNNVKGNMLGAQFAGFGNLVGGEVSGMQAAGFFNNNKGDVLGAQFAGFSNTSFGNVDGLQAAGFLNIAKESVEGVQVAGYINLTLKNTTGAQISNFINVTGDTLRKFQISGLANYAKYVEGLQIAVLGNFVYKNVTGAQIAGLVNVTADTVHKMQLSGITNYAKNVKGVQFSTILNVAKNVHGLQFSLFNYADSVKGASIGLLSFVKKGYHPFELSHSDFGMSTMRLKTGTRSFYNVFELGANIYPKNTFNYLGYGFGHSFKLKKNRAYLDWDVVTGSINGPANYDMYFNLLSRFSFSFSYRVFGPIYFFISPTLNNFAYNPLLTPPFEYLHKPESIINSENIKIDSWIGYQFGIRI